jgi:hypothetical protein
MKKMLKVNQCSDSLLWYKNKVGHLIPFLGEDQDRRGPIFWSREDAGYKNIVFQRDAEIVEVEEINL